ncbi:MAG: hypothetical protein K0R73_1099 [Candidatus Midichloriaceae bacterium]|jgi:hypothetical protein|nr:hypothetical protein [Candidatus Midichloriaceae bacterium]
MKTLNYQIQLLSQNQAMKEFTINHSLNKISWLLNRAIIDFTAELPAQKSEGDMYIITASNQAPAEMRNKIFIYLDGDWQMIEPGERALFYISGKKAFYIFLQGEWKAA